MKKRGITLTEIMIAIGIMSIVSVPIYYLLSDSQKKANISIARDNIKQEANKILTVLENDLSQARKGSFEQPDEKNFTIKVRKSEDKDVTLRYTLLESNLYRLLEDKRWCVSSQVDRFEVTPSPDGNGKLVIGLGMKARHVGLNDDEQPTYEQEKLIVMMEDATEANDPFWREVGDVNKFFATEGSIMNGLKEDAEQLVENFMDTWKDLYGDIENMTVGELKNAAASLKSSLSQLQGNLRDLDKDILDLDWHVMYDRGFLGIGDKSKKRAATRIKNTIASMTCLQEMDWNKVKSVARRGMKERDIKNLFEAKQELYKSRKEMVETLNQIQEQAGEGVDVGISKDDLIAKDK